MNKRSLFTPWDAGNRFYFICIVVDGKRMGAECLIRRCDTIFLVRNRVDC